MMIVLSILAAILAGAGRAAVGAGWLPRGAVYPVCGTIVALAAFNVPGAAFAAVGAATLWLGHTKWEDPAYMAARYGLPAMIAVLVSGYFTHDPYPVLWAVSCSAVGVMYQVMLGKWEAVSFDIFGLYINGNRIAEFIAGAVILGGVAFL